MGFTRAPGPSSNQSHTYDAWGNAEDMTELVTNIDPEETFFLKNLKADRDAFEPEYSWPLEGLAVAGKNAIKEKEKYTFKPVGSMRHLSNVIQKFLVTGYVTDDQIKVKKVYSEQDELAHQITKALKKIAADMEYAIVKNSKVVKRAAETAPETGGIPYFMQMDTMDCTPSYSENKITTSTPHNLSDGDFVYFTGTTLPNGLKENVHYYVELDAETPATEFYLHDTLQGAVEKKREKRVEFSSDGSAVKILKNNIIDVKNKVFTVDDLNNAMQLAYNRGGNPSMAIMSGSNKRRFSSIVSGVATTNRKSGDHKMDIVTDVFTSDFGTITARAHRLYDDDRIDMLEMQYNKLKWFRHPHQVKDLPKEGNFTPFAIAGDLGFKCVQPNANASILGIKRSNA